MIQSWTKSSDVINDWIHIMFAPVKFPQPKGNENIYWRLSRNILFHQSFQLQNAVLLIQSIEISCVLTLEVHCQQEQLGQGNLFSCIEFLWIWKPETNRNTIHQWDSIFRTAESSEICATGKVRKFSRTRFIFVPFCVYLSSELIV
jgi:hypothetical protein